MMNMTIRNLLLLVISVQAMASLLRSADTFSVGDLDFSHIDGLDMTKPDDETERNTLMNSRIARNAEDMTVEDEAMEEAVQLPNGNWACKHKCGDKTRFALVKSMILLS